MSHGAFRQADLERVFRAARNAGSEVRIDIRSLIVTVIPAIHRPDEIDAANDRPRILPPGNLAPDGKENFDED